MPRPYFAWASCCAPLLGVLIGWLFLEGVLGLLVGTALASVPGMLCSFVAYKRGERWYGWVIGALLNAYGLLVLLFGLGVYVGAIRVHF